MSKKSSFIDAHSHLVDLRIGEAVHTIIPLAESLGCQFFMQGGVDPDDWQRQKDLSSQYLGKIGTCFGLHPYWVSENSSEACELALDYLASEALSAMALGEMGLDFRRKIVGDRHNHQIDYFEKQLELANFVKKPIVLHIVQAHEEALNVIRTWDQSRPNLGFVHSFNGSAHKAQELLAEGLLLSIGGPVCRPDNQRLRQAVKEIPLDCLLLESDSPDQAAFPEKGLLNTPESVIDVARTIGMIKSLDPDEIFDITTANFKRLFSLA